MTNSMGTSAIAYLRTAQASGERWGSIVKAALTALGPIPPGANFGLAYLTRELAEDLPSVLTFLRETTPIKHWTVAIGAGLIGPLSAVRDRPALALMVAILPPGSFQTLESWQEQGRERFLARHRDWLAGQNMPVALVHGHAGEGDLAEMIADLAAVTGSFLIGGVTLSPVAGLSGVMLGGKLSLITGLTQGCLPLGEIHRVSEASDNVIMGLDGRSALDVMREILDSKMAQDLRRAAGVIHVGLPVPGADRTDYLVRPLIAIDPTRGWLAINAQISVGDRVMFVKRDGDSARKDMQRMLSDVAQRAGQRRIMGGIYISCIARGEQMFGFDNAEPMMIKEALGDFPLIGLIGQGEFCHDRVYGFTGVLALFLA
jgi:small ligand-binding sensory domain FIST